MTSYHGITSIGAVALSLTALAAPAGAANTKPRSTRPSVAPTIVRVTPSGGGFDWGDAGIGAAGGFALAMIGIGGVLAISQRRPHRRPEDQPIHGAS